MKFFVSLLLALLVQIVAYSQDKSIAYNTKYVVILVIDGPRYSETFGDTACRYIPNLCNELKNEGVFYSNFRNNGPTYTVPGHTAMTTGFYQKMANTGTALPKNPSIFQYYLANRKTPSSDAYVISAKGKLNVLGKTSNKTWKNQFLPETYCGPNGNGITYGTDAETMEKSTELLTSEKPPHLMLINLLAVDVWGHAGNYKKYLESLVKCDQYALTIWNMIQSNPALKDQTTLFITNDHGRHLDKHKNGFVSHGDNCEGCRHISLLVLGPDCPKGKTIVQEGELIDLSKTISEILNFEMPNLKGRFLEEAFKKD